MEIVIPARLQVSVCDFGEDPHAFIHVPRPSLEKHDVTDVLTKYAEPAPLQLSLSELNQRLGFIAQTALETIVTNMSAGTTFQSTNGLGCAGDTVAVEGGRKAELNHHTAVTAASDALISNSLRFVTAARELADAFANYFLAKAAGKNILFAQLPGVLPGIGVNMVRADMLNINLRAVMFYSPKTLSTEITVDALWGEIVPSSMTAEEIEVLNNARIMASLERLRAQSLTNNVEPR